MKRLAIKLVLFLLLGAIVNVAVAWWLGATTQRWFGTSLVVTRLSNGTDWLVYRDEGFGKTRIVLHVCGCPFTDAAGLAVRQPPQNLFSAWSRIRVPQLPSDSDLKIRMVNGSRVMSAPAQTIVDEAFGFPARSFWCGWGELSVFSFLATSVTPIPIRHGIELRPPNALGTGGSAIPLRPIWPGFAINTIFYAAVLWGGLWIVFATPGFVRRRIRRFRGRCIHCGYDLRGHVPGADSTKCPECGRSQSGETQTRRHAETVA